MAELTNTYMVVMISDSVMIICTSELCKNNVGFSEDEFLFVYVEFPVAMWSFKNTGEK